MGEKMGGGPAATCNAMKVLSPCHPQAQPRGPLWGPPGQGSRAAALWPHTWMAGSEGLSLRSAPRDRGVREKEPGHRPWRCGPCSQGPRREGSGGLGGAQDGRRLRPSPALRACCGHWATSGGSLPRRQGRPLAGQRSGTQHRGARTARPRATCLPPGPWLQTKMGRFAQLLPGGTELRPRSGEGVPGKVPPGLAWQVEARSRRGSGRLALPTLCTAAEGAQRLRSGAGPFAEKGPPCAVATIVPSDRVHRRLAGRPPPLPGLGFVSGRGRAGITSVPWSGGLRTRGPGG